MRRVIIPVLLAACFSAAIALAASDQKTAKFEGLATSGVSGDARLNAMPSGGVLVHESIRGLQPNTQYVTFIYANGTCATGTTPLELARFTSNAAGVAQVNEKVTQNIDAIGSLSIQLVSSNAVVACGAVQ